MLAQPRHQAVIQVECSSFIMCELSFERRRINGKLALKLLPHIVVLVTLGGYLVARDQVLDELLGDVLMLLRERVRDVLRLFLEKDGGFFKDNRLDLLELLFVV